MNQLSKSNVTMWKNRDAAQDPKARKTNSSTKITKSQTLNKPKGKMENSKQIENEFIENLKKQIYFMEMELKLMKEREREIAKSGGFTQLFNDDKDPAIHIQQLKVKYANMRKKMEDQIEQLNENKRNVTGQNVALKAKLNSLQKLELDAYNKLKNLNQNGENKLYQINSKFLEKDNERINTEANNRLQDTKLKATIDNNENLQFNIDGGDAMAKMDQEDFDDEIRLIEDLTNAKDKEYVETKAEIDKINGEAESIMTYKETVDDNERLKKEISELKDDVIRLNAEAECAELLNNFVIKKKNEAVNERKKYIDLNIELKHEIEAKNTINDNRIQKKVREANSEEIMKLNEHLNETNEKIADLENKIAKEIQKIHTFTQEIIKCKIKTKHKTEENETCMKNIDKKHEELENLNNTKESYETEYTNLKDKIGKEKTDNELLRNKHKKLQEENAAVVSKYEFITGNYDFTTNLKKISLEDLKNLAQSNNMVNSTIDTFVDKVGAFKRSNIQSLLFDENNL